MKLLDRAGVLVPRFGEVIKTCKDFRDVVVALYDHQEIKEKLRAELTPLLKDRNFKNVFIASHLLKWVGQDADAAFLRSVTQCDARLIPDGPVAQDVVAQGGAP